MLILVCTLSEAMMNGQWRSRMVYLAALALGTLLLYFGMLLAAPGAMDLYRCLLVVTLLSLIFVAIYAFRANLRNIFITIGLFLTAMLFVPTTDYIFNSILKEHQQNRILSFLGLVSDPLGTDYNVNQAKIAIGSGGWIGKGFLQGTQIKYGFVPEKHTDFIFCTIGEEWGFLGAMLLLTLFCLLIFRLMRMGERQEEPFGRIYCYCVAAFLLFHLLVNVGMTIGLMPVMGIPLPLVSYGGSSLMAFTIMLFIAVRLDASTRKGLQVWDCHENKRDGSTYRDAATGEVLLQIKSNTDVGRCMAADIDPTHPGVEMWSGDSQGIRNVKGEIIAPKMRNMPTNMAVWWDGDLLRELLDRNMIIKYDWENKKFVPLVKFTGTLFNNGTKSNPCLQGDIIGDWREEVLVRSENNAALRLYVSTIPTEYRFHTFLEEPIYRISIATQNVGYNQPTQPGFYFGPDLIKMKGTFRGYQFK